MESIKLIWERGNLHTGSVYGVQVEQPFASTELHGPFSSENEAWNYGMALANESVSSGRAESFTLVTIETPVVKSIATAEEIREHRRTVGT